MGRWNLTAITNGEFSSFIGRWDVIPEELCKQIISDCDKDLNHGVTGPDYKTAPLAKQSLDRAFTLDNAPDSILGAMRILAECLEGYKQEYPTSDSVDYFSAYKISFQKYLPGWAYWVMHSERMCLADGARHLVWMIYLNTVEDCGGTYFKNQNLMVQARAGRVLIWPTDWTHTHMGIVSPSETKYILTGWYEYDQVSDKQ